MPAPAQIVAQQNDVDGVPLKVYVPAGAGDLERHLSRSGGCLAVSQVRGGTATVVLAFDLRGGRVTPRANGPCRGAPRIVRDTNLNRAIGDPIGQARVHAGQHGMSSSGLALQVILTPTLYGVAERALVARYGPIPKSDMARKAAAEGYILKCWAAADGRVTCQ